MAARLSSRRVQIAVVCILAAVVLYNAAHFLGRKPRKQTLVYEEALFEDGIGPGMTPTWATGEYKPAASWGVNPFTGKRVLNSPAAAGPAGQPRGASGPGSAAVRITGVVISGDSRYVLAGDLLLREGDRLGAGRIKTINRDSVIVEYETGTKTIYID